MSKVAETTQSVASAAYLIYLGLKTLLTKEKTGQGQEVKRVSLSRVFYQGMVVNLLNPKTALFFLAFLPQFIDAVPHHPRSPEEDYLNHSSMTFSVITLCRPTP